MKSSRKALGAVLTGSMVALVLAPMLTIFAGVFLDATTASAVASATTTAAVGIVSFVLQSKEWRIEALRAKRAELHEQRIALEKMLGLGSHLDLLLSHEVPESDAVAVNVSSHQLTWLRERNELLELLGKLAAEAGIGEHFRSLAPIMYDYNGNVFWMGSGKPEAPNSVREAVVAFKSAVSAALSQVNMELSELSTEN